MHGCIDIHSHLLPGVDDGCQSLEASLECARALVAAGYTDAFCTPHIWRSLPANTPERIPALVAALQKSLDESAIPLRLHPGGEINLHPEVQATLEGGIMSFAASGRFALMDLWANSLDPWLDETIRWMQSSGLTLILAHPERMRAIQDDPNRVDFFLERGVLLQCNLQCIGDPPHTDTNRTAIRLLEERKYFAAATDMHNPQSIASRMRGLDVLRKMVDHEYCDRLLRTNPRLLLTTAAGS